MKRIVILSLVLAVAAGCMSGTKKQFTLTVDPPDAKITVIDQPDKPGTSYTSPAHISALVPLDPALAGHSRVVISRDDYKTTELLLGSVQGSSIRIKLAKALQYRLKYRLLTPTPSDELVFEDRVVAVRITPRESDFDLKIDNLSGRPLTILWDKADYTDVAYRTHQLIHSGIDPKLLGDRIPPQTIEAGGTLRESVMSEDAVVVRKKDKKLVASPLFDLNKESALLLKGKTVSIFLPLELDRAIIPTYTFTILIEDVIKE
jgi:hypothetical protein